MANLRFANLQGEIVYPPLPHLWAEGIFKGGGGCTFWSPPQQDFYTPPPLFYTPPPLGGYFQGWGGVYKNWPIPNLRLGNRWLSVANLGKQCYKWRKRWWVKGDGTKVTENAQNADFRRELQIFADSRLLLEIETFGGRRKPQKTADFRRKPKIVAENRRKPLIGHRHLRCVTFSSALGKETWAIIPYIVRTVWNRAGPM